MTDNDLQSIWRSYDQKMEKVLTINRELVIDLTKRKLNKKINTLYRPKATMILLGLPYTLLLYAITITAALGGAFFVALGFGAIAVIMTVLLIAVFYHLHLIRQINISDDVVHTQEQLSRLRISSFNCARLAVVQLPFWSICWMSLDALSSSPWLYGGTNLFVFLGLSYLAYWLYKELSHKKGGSKVRQFFLSGSEWDPIIKSAEILEQIKKYKVQ